MPKNDLVPGFADIKGSENRGLCNAGSIIKRIGALALPFFLVVQSLIKVALGATYYVSPLGDDNNPGTEAFPWRTVQRAATVAGPGDTVVARQGDYQERVILKNSGFEGAPIIFESDPPREANILHGFDVNRQNFVIIKGFKITNDSGGWKQHGIWLSGSHIEIRDNFFYDIPGIAVVASWEGVSMEKNKIVGNKVTGCQYGFFISGKDWVVEKNEIERLVNRSGGDSDYVRFWGENHTIRGNYFHGTRKEEVGDAHVDAFQTYAINNGEYAKNILFENNIVKGFHHQTFMMESKSGLHDNIMIRNNIFDGGSIEGGGSWGICAAGIINLKIYNNIFINYRYHGIGIHFGLDGITPSTALIKNNIFYNAGSNYWKESRCEICQLDSSNNLLYSDRNIINSASYPRDLVNVDPGFVNITGYDFHLSKDSPGIDSGAVVQEVDRDIEGVSRPQGKGWDIGAHEYVPEIPSAPKNLRLMR